MTYIVLYIVICLCVLVWETAKTHYTTTPEPVLIPTMEVKYEISRLTTCDVLRVVDEQYLDYVEHHLVSSFVPALTPFVTYEIHDDNKHPLSLPMIVATLHVVEPRKRTPLRGCIQKDKPVKTFSTMYGGLPV